MNRRLSLIVVALLLVSVGSGAALLLRSAGADMTTSAEKFLGSLTAEQRAKAMMKFDDPARLKWHFIPLPERKGVQIKEMNAEQRKLAHELLRAALSQLGYDKADTIMGLEAILRELEKTRKDGPIRDPERYYFTVFGTPTAAGQWGLSVEGHHLSLNFVVKDGQVVAHTPAFFGANPAIVMSEIPDTAKKGTRVLAKEEELAFDLLKSLTADQRKLAVIDAAAPKEIRAAGEPQPPQAAPAGIAASAMAEPQLKTLNALIETYAANMPAEVGAARLAEIKEAGIGKVHFAWAGPDKPGIGHYYRLQGPTFLVEFINTQPDAAGNQANHIHSVWRNMQGDFGVKAQ
jgi:hypothetical protein